MFVLSGGYDRGECLDSMERYDPRTNKWSPMPCMTTARARFDQGAAAAAKEADSPRSGSQSARGATGGENREMRRPAWTRAFRHYSSLILVLYG